MPPQEMNQSNEQQQEQDIDNFLLSDDKVNENGADHLPEEKPAKVAKEEKEDKEDEIKLADEDGKESDEEEEPELSEEELQLVTPFNRQALVKKYPNLPKEFPYLFKGLERDKQFTEIFPTVQDAKDAQEQIEQFNNFQNDIFGGSLNTTLKAIYETDKQAFGKIVDGYMDSLQQVDPGAFTHIMSNIYRRTVESMVRTSEKLNNNDLKVAATLLHQFIFGNVDYQPASQFSRPTQTDPEREKFNQERQTYETQRYRNLYEDVSTRCTNRAYATLDNNMDPKETFTPYVKKAAVDQAMELVHEEIRGDEQFGALMQRQWQKVVNSNYDKSQVSKLESLYMHRAKQAMPRALKIARNEALKGMGKRVKEDNEQEEQQSSQRRRIPVGTPVRNSNQQEKPKNMSIDEFFMRD